VLAQPTAFPGSGQGADAQVQEGAWRGCGARTRGRQPEDIGQAVIQAPEA